MPVSQEQEPEPLVGREAEMRKLNALLDRAANGTGGMAMLTGEPGIGKTALAGSFLFSAARRFPQILAGRGACVEQYGTGEAYLPFLETLSGLLSGPARGRGTAPPGTHLVPAISRGVFG
jgi:predicted ATPase